MRDLERRDKLEARRRLLRKLAVGTSAVAAILLALSGGAVASAARADPPSTLILQQSLDGHVECVSPDATCTIINLYGQNGDPGESPIAPGQHHVTTVVLRNAGTLTASSLSVAAGSCTNQLCGTVEVATVCTTGGMITFSFGPATLDAFGASGTHAVNTGLAPGASTTCTFTVTYPPDAPGIVAARSVQPVTWTLTASEAPPTTSPPTTRPPTTSKPPTTSPPTSAPPSTTPSRVPPTKPAAIPPLLAMTGVDARALAIAGLVLLAIGAVLFRLSSRHDRGSGESPSAGDVR